MKGRNVMSLLEAKNIKKVYKTRFGGASVEALRNVSFTVEQGEYVAIMGESGSGKTTLLNILAALDKATEGTVILDGKMSQNSEGIISDLFSRILTCSILSRLKTISIFRWCLQERSIPR